MTGISAMQDGLVFNIQRYSLQDGPGIRTTVFLKGCPLCCQWCHNPEGISRRPEIVIVETRCIVCGACRDACPLADAMEGEGPMSTRNPDCTQCGACIDACPTGARQMIGRTMTVAEVIDEAMRDRVFFEDSGGGVTISGGEPLMQSPFVCALLEAFRAREIHTALDTTGLARWETLRAAANLAGLVLYDLKAFDESQHLKLTGVSNRSILDNLKRLDLVHSNIWIRIPVVPGFNDDLPNFQHLAEFVAPLHNVQLVNLLPFHNTGLHKFERLGKTHVLAGVKPPSAEAMQQAARIFEAHGLKTKVGG